MVKKLVFLKNEERRTSRGLQIFKFLLEWKKKLTKLQNKNNKRWVERTFINHVLHYLADKRKRIYQSVL